MGGKKKQRKKANPQKKQGKKANPQKKQEEKANPQKKQDSEEEWIENNKEWVTKCDTLVDEIIIQDRNIVETSSENRETDNPVTLGSSQGEIEDTNLLRSDCAGSSPSRPSGENANAQSSIKEAKNNLPNSSSSWSSTSLAPGQNANQQSSIKEAKHINQPNSSSKQTSSVYNTEHQVDQKNGNRKKRKKAKNNRIRQEEISEIQPNLPVLKHTKPVTENKKLGSNINEASQSCSQSVPQKYSDNNKCQKDDKAIMQVKAENKATAKVETLEPNKSIEVVSNTLKCVPQKEIQKTEDLNKEKKQQKLRTYQAEKKLLTEQEQELLWPAKATQKKVKGRIEVLATDKSVKKIDKESSLCFEHEKKSGKIFIKDKNIQIAIHVPEGIQVVCKSRTRPVTDLLEDVKSNSCAQEDYSTARPEDIKTELCEDVKSRSSTLEGHATARQEVIKTVSEKYCKPTSDTRCDAHIKFTNQNCPTVDDQVAGVMATNALIVSDPHGETRDDSKQSSSNVGEFPKERYASRITSEVQENIRKVSDEFKKDVQAACKKYIRRMENYIRRNFFKSSD